MFQHSDSLDWRPDIALVSYETNSPAELLDRNVRLMLSAAADPKETKVGHYGSSWRLTEMGQRTNALARELNVAASGMNMTV